jgi:hypothetical protein
MSSLRALASDRMRRARAVYSRPVALANFRAVVQLLLPADFVSTRVSILIVGVSPWILVIVNVYRGSNVLKDVPGFQPTTA